MKGPVVASVLILFAGVNCLWPVSASASDTPKKPPRPKPTHHIHRNLCGWSVRVDDRLLATNSSALGERALKLLEARLIVIAAVMSDEPLKRVREVPI